MKKGMRKVKVMKEEYLDKMKKIREDRKKDGSKNKKGRERKKSRR